MILLQPLNNVSISVKSLGSALISAIALVALAWLAIAGFVEIRQANTTQNHSAAVMSQARDAWIDLARGQAALYRAINLKSQNVEVKLVRAAKDEAIAAIGDARKSVASLNTTGLLIDPRLANEAGKSIAAYADSAGQAASFVEEDAFNATMFMTDAEQKFGVAQQDVASLVASAVKLDGAADMRLNAIIHDRLVDIAIGAVVAILLAAALSALLGRILSRPIVAMTGAMRRLAGGELDVEIPAADHTDEVGQMAQAMLVFRGHAQEARRLQAAADKANALKARRQAAMDRHTQDFGTSAAGVMASLGRSASAMRQIAGDMSEAARRTHERAANAAESAVAATTNLSAVSAAAEQMSASINEISQQVARATQAANEAVERANVTDVKVAGMAAAADLVGDVIKLITEIAGRTNLLALNATIEAARAGEAGKGFAVVAGEVKGLATQTTTATKEIATQIAAIRTATGEAVNAVRAVNAAIGEVNQVATAIAAAVEQQAAATREIAASVQAVTVAAQDATLSMREVSSISETTDSASAKVLAGADELGHNADTLRGEVTQFLQAMASANEEDRRRYERVAGNGAEVVMRTTGQPDRRAVIADISRGGMAIRSDWKPEAGAEVRVELPFAGAPVTARVVRWHDGVLAFAFRQDEETRRRIDRAMERIAAGAMQAAA